MSYAVKGVNRRLAMAVAGILMTSTQRGLVWAQTTTPPAETVTQVAEGTRYLFEDKIKPGMKGYGLTVMHGAKIDRFDIEIIDVVKNFMPGTNMILVRCSGLGLEHSGIIAGMSGSPIFIDGKMIGAVAYAWGAAKDPIAGVQPIRQMLTIPVAKKNNGVQMAADTHSGGRWDTASQDPLKMLALQRAGWGRLVKSVARDSGTMNPLSSATPHAGNLQLTGLRPVASPVMVSGAGAEQLNFLRESLEPLGLIPVASGGGAAGGADGVPLGGVADLTPGQLKLEPGSALALPLVSGDMDLSAIGTVTEVRDGRVWAFGHAMLAEGPSELPIATGYIYTTMPNLLQSVKMGSSYQNVGALVSDEQTGIVGQVGALPKSVPVELTVRNSDKSLNRVYHYQMIRHPRLTPEVLMAAISQSFTAQRQLPKDFTARLRGEIKFEGTGLAAGSALKVDSLGTSRGFQFMEIMLPIAILGDNPFENLKIGGITLEAQIEPTDRSAEIKSITLDRDVVAPGDELVATVELAPFQAKERTVQIRVKVPADAADGDYQLAVGSRETAISDEEEHFPQRYSPENIGGLFGALQRVMEYKSDQIYARLAMNVQGASEDGRELKDLPASRIAMYTSPKRMNVSPLYNLVGAQVDAGAVVEEGGQTFSITVDKDAEKRFYSPDHKGLSLPGRSPGMAIPRRLPERDPGVVPAG